MDLKKVNFLDRTFGMTDRARTTNSEEDKKKIESEMVRTKEFVQGVINKRRLRLDLEKAISHSAPVSPASNISEIDLVWDEEEARSTKRRREESKMMDMEEDVGHAHPLASKIRRIIRQIGKEVRDVAKYARERNTKKDIKEGTKTLLSLVSQLQTSEAQALLQSLGRHVGGREQADTELSERLGKLEEENDGLKVENATLREEIRGLVTKRGENGNKRDIAVQCDNGKGSTTVTDEDIDGAKTYETYKGLRNYRWPENIYKAAFMTEGLPTRANEEAESLVIYEDQDTEGKNAGITEAFESKYPELKEMEGRMTQIIINHKVIITKGETRTTEKVITRVALDGGLENWFEALCEIRDRAIVGGRKKLALYPPSYDAEGRETRRIAECVLRNTGIKGIIYTKKRRGRQEDKTGKDKISTDAIIIKQEGKTYCELLKSVKEVVTKENGAAESIQMIRKTKEGNLAIIMDNKDKVNTSKLREQIDRVKEWDVRISRDKKKDMVNVVIKDIDGITEKEEVTEAIKVHLGPGKEEELKVGELRPYFGGNQAVTVTLEKNEARRLLDRGKIRIGLSMCSVNEMVGVMRCFRCYKYGHSRAECREEMDYTSACRNCGESGHVARDCNIGDYCLTCRVPNHRAGSLRCPEFKKALSRSRMRAKKKKAW